MKRPDAVANGRCASHRETTPGIQVRSVLARDEESKVDATPCGITIPALETVAITRTVVPRMENYLAENKFGV